MRIEPDWQLEPARLRRHGPRVSEAERRARNLESRHDARVAHWQTTRTIDHVDEGMAFGRERDPLLGSFRLGLRLHAERAVPAPATTVPEDGLASRRFDEQHELAGREAAHAEGAGGIRAVEHRVGPQRFGQRLPLQRRQRVPNAIALERQPRGDHLEHRYRPSAGGLDHAAADHEPRGEHVAPRLQRRAQIAGDETAMSRACDHQVEETAAAARRQEVVGAICARARGLALRGCVVEQRHERVAERRASALHHLTEDPRLGSSHGFALRRQRGRKRRGHAVSADGCRCRRQRDGARRGARFGWRRGRAPQREDQTDQQRKRDARDHRSLADHVRAITLAPARAFRATRARQRPPHPRGSRLTIRRVRRRRCAACAS